MLRNAFFKSLRDQARPLDHVGGRRGVLRGPAACRSTRASGTAPASCRATSTVCRRRCAPRSWALGGDFSSPVGYVNVELLSWLAPIIFIAFAVSIAARALAGEEENGTLSLLLAHTVGRRRLVLQKYAAMIVVVGILGVAFWLTLLVATGSPARRWAPANWPRRYCA
jgi:hypothetical protein